MVKKFHKFKTETLQHYLDSNMTAYAEYFEWKNYFKVSFDYNRPFCQLCEALNRPNVVAPKRLKNLKEWWRDDGSCVFGQNLPWGNG